MDTDMSLTLVHKMKVREVYRYTKTPAYEVLYFEREGKGWKALTRHDGKRALFSRPPVSMQEAIDLLKVIEEKEKTQEETNHGKNEG